MKPKTGPGSNSLKPYTYGGMRFNPLALPHGRITSHSETGWISVFCREPEMGAGEAKHMERMAKLNRQAGIR